MLDNRKIGFVFPGQGSQIVGMFKDIATEYPKFLETFQEASEILGYDLWHLIQNDEEKLNDTEFTQPCLLTTEIALYRLITSLRPDLTPHIMSGHSLGEFSAWVAAKTLDFKTALKMVHHRALIMKNHFSPDQVAMVAILGLDYFTVDDICNNVNNTHESYWKVVNINSPLQIIVGGPRDELDNLILNAEVMGAKKVIELNVRVLSHSPALEPVSCAFDNYLKDIEFKTPCIDVVNNVEAQIETNPQIIKEQLSNQLYRPVQWVRVVERMIKEGVTEFYEIGPNKVLTGLSKRINKNVPINSISDLKSFQNFIQQ